MNSIPAWRRTWSLMLLLTCLCGGLYVLLSKYNVLDKIPLLKGVKNSYSQHLVAMEAAEPPVRRILLVTHGRSGSTFTSYIIKEALPDVFYFFEPLRPLLVKATGGLGMIMNYEAIGGAHSQVQELPVVNLTSYERNAVDLLDKLFNCEIGKYPVTDYLSSHFRIHGNVAAVANCLKSMVNESYLNLSHYLQCVLDFWHSCQNSELRLFKVIRLPARALFSLLRKQPDLRVIYLVRDPRPVLASQAALFGRAPEPKHLCRMLVDDAAHMKLLQDTFPSRALALRYEDISNDPLLYSRRLYEALGLRLNSSVEWRIHQMTSATSKRDREKYNVFRSDSREAASKWRTKIDVQAVQVDDEVCGEAYQWLGYIRAPNTSVLRDLNVSLTGSSYRLPFL